MNAAPIILGIFLVASCSALPEQALRQVKNETHLDYIKQPRIPEAHLNYTKQPRAPEFKLPMLGNRERNFLECTKKTQKITLGVNEWVYFQSPNYPEDYPSKTKCSWQFKSKEQLNIECYNVGLEKPKKGKCKNDVLTIGSEKYCGNEEHIYQYDAGKSVKVQFKSNKKKNYHGFMCYAYVYEPLSSTYSPGSSSYSSEWPTAAPPTGDPDSSCKCGQANRVSRIVGGEKTEENEYPWQAAMVYAHSSAVFCGASVIGSKHILTAAHCTEAVTQYGINYQVLVGAHSLDKSPTASQQHLNPSKFIQHKDYDDWTLDNDISIIVLKSHISFSREISPICLPTSADDDFDNVDAIVSGWGALEEGGIQPDKLMEVTVPTMTNKKCEKYYGSDGITDNMLCAGYEEGEKDSCQGDSGGPLITYIPNSYYQIGVVSWGSGCARPNAPGVYARVTKYLDWIADITASSEMCPPA